MQNTRLQLWRAQESTETRVPKDHSSPIRREAPLARGTSMNARGISVKHSHRMTIPPLSPVASTAANNSGIKFRLCTLSVSLQHDFASLYLCFYFLLTLVCLLLFQVTALFISSSLLPCFVSVFLPSLRRPKSFLSVTFLLFQIPFNSHWFNYFLFHFTIHPPYPFIPGLLPHNLWDVNGCDPEWEITPISNVNCNLKIYDGIQPLFNSVRQSLASAM